MKKVAAPFRLLCAAALLLGSSLAGCVRSEPVSGAAGQPRRIPLAPIGAASPGIGGPGAGSADTRGTGTIASGEGDTPLDAPSTGNVPASAAGVTPGTTARSGSRY